MQVTQDIFLRYDFTLYGWFWFWSGHFITAFYMSNSYHHLSIHVLVSCMLWDSLWSINGILSHENVKKISGIPSKMKWWCTVCVLQSWRIRIWHDTVDSLSKNPGYVTYSIYDNATLSLLILEVFLMSCYNHTIRDVSVVVFWCSAQIWFLPARSHPRLFVCQGSGVGRRAGGPRGILVDNNYYRQSRHLVSQPLLC